LGGAAPDTQAPHHNCDDDDDDDDEGESHRQRERGIGWGVDGGVKNDH